MPLTKLQNKSATPRSNNNDEAIVIRKGRVHNLKNIDVTLPRDQLVVITGPSGSGKSSLAFDTIYSEGQRRYIESLSVYARQFLSRRGRPEVESITGLSPTISIQQKTSSYNPRSTVGTVTEVYDYLRLLFARIGRPYCWQCLNRIQSQNQKQIVDQILHLPENTKLSLLAPIVRERKGAHQKELMELRYQGFTRVRLDGETYDLSEEIAPAKNKKHNIEVYIDRIVIRSNKPNLEQRANQAVDLGLRTGGGFLLLKTEREGKNEEAIISQNFACPDCGISYPDPEPRTFSFNSRLGACETCEGTGLTPGKENVSIPCSSCEGSRLKKESRHYYLGSKNLPQLSDMGLDELLEFLKNLSLTTRENQIADRIFKQLQERLFFLNQVGVSYLSLNRPANTLSGGESQRIRLATQIGSSLVGVIYVLDEPSIGLHPRDHHRLLKMLHRLRDLGNTVLVVEHDRETIEQAEHIIDLGPGAGAHGGWITGQGSLAEIKNQPKSLTGRYLANQKTIPLPQKRRPIESKKQIVLKNANLNNLKKLNISFPLGVLTCVTGVSGSGKSTLVVDTLFRALQKNLYRTKTGTLKLQSIRGLQNIDKVIDIDQSPIGRSPRSNPATYVGIFGRIRKLFAQLPEAQIRGYQPGRFSFNVAEGRCASCEGDGVQRIEMHFLPDVYVHCEDCNGRRFNQETLEVTYKGKTIADILEMTVEEALQFFHSIPTLRHKLTALNEVGLGYLRLGQSSTTLSGGEAQRIKLARELARKSTGRTFYILDEPSTGLHFDDIQELLKTLQTLVDKGNTVLIIEHNLDIIKVADYLIDLGPEGGEKGGQIVAQGTPEQVTRAKKSYTGQFLERYLE